MIINGGWQLSAGHGAALDRDAAVRDLVRLVEAGYDTFDVGDIYTGVEELLGDVIRAAGGTRVRVHTKLVPDLDALPGLDRDSVRRIVDRSRQRLGVEQLDLVQLHWWDYDVPGYVDAAGWLDELRVEGAVAALGATNFDVPRLRELLDAGIPIASHQVQLSLLDRRPHHGMIDLCHERDVSLLCYGTLAGGFLTDRWRGASPPTEIENRSLVKYRLIIDECGGWDAFQDVLGTASVVADNHDVDVATVAMRYALDQPQVAGIIVGARDARHLDRRRAVLDLRLDDEDHARLDAATEGPAGDVYDLERVKGGRHAAIMRYDLNRRA